MIPAAPLKTARLIALDLLFWLGSYLGICIFSA